MEGVTIKTIIYDATGFYISGQLWRDAAYAFRHRNDACLHKHGVYCNCRGLREIHDWRWIGGPGWFGTDENKALYTHLGSLIDLDLGNWYDLEHREVDITL